MRYEQQITADVSEAAIHPIFIVGKHPIRKQPLQQPVGLTFGIAPFNANKHQQPTVDLSNLLTANMDGSAGDALKQANHGARG